MTGTARHVLIVLGSLLVAVSAGALQPPPPPTPCEQNGQIVPVVDATDAWRVFRKPRFNSTTSEWVWSKAIDGGDWEPSPGDGLPCPSSGWMSFAHTFAYGLFNEDAPWHPPLLDPDLY